MKVTTASEQGEVTSIVNNVSPEKLVPVIAPVTWIDKGMVVAEAAVRVNYRKLGVNVSQVGR